MEDLLRNINDLNQRLEESGYKTVDVSDLHSKEMIGVVVLDHINEIVERMEITVQQIESSDEMERVTEDTYIVENGLEIVRECLLD